MKKGEVEQNMVEMLVDAVCDEESEVVDITEVLQAKKPFESRWSKYL